MGEGEDKLTDFRQTLFEICHKLLCQLLLQMFLYVLWQHPGMSAKHFWHDTIDRKTDNAEQIWVSPDVLVLDVSWPCCSSSLLAEYGSPDVSICSRTARSDTTVKNGVCNAAGLLHEQRTVDQTATGTRWRPWFKLSWNHLASQNLKKQTNKNNDR